MKNFKNYSAFAAALTILMVLLVVPNSESKNQSSGIERLIAVTQMKAQTASDEAMRGAEKQRSLVADQERLRANTGRLTSREVAREKAVLQQLEANARRAAEVLESVKRLAAEVDRQPAKMDGIQYLVSVTQMKAQTAGNEASRAAGLVKSLIGKAIGNGANDGAQSPQTGRLTSREIAREKAVLQQLEANAKRSAEVLESVKRLAAEVERQPRR